MAANFLPERVKFYGTNLAMIKSANYSPTSGNLAENAARARMVTMNLELGRWR
jgi:hypothetical protein